MYFIMIFELYYIYNCFNHSFKGIVFKNVTKYIHEPSVSMSQPMNHIYLAGTTRPFERCDLYSQLFLFGIYCNSDKYLLLCLNQVFYIPKV